MAHERHPPVETVSLRARYIAAIGRYPEPDADIEMLDRLMNRRFTRQRARAIAPQRAIPASGRLSASRKARTAMCSVAVEVRQSCSMVDLVWRRFTARSFQVVVHPSF